MSSGLYDLSGHIVCIICLCLCISHCLDPYKHNLQLIANQSALNLSLNSAKSQYLVVGSPALLSRLQSFNVSLNSVPLETSSVIRIFGLYLIALGHLYIMSPSNVEQLMRVFVSYIFFVIYSLCLTETSFKYQSFLYSTTPISCMCLV